MVDSGNLHSMVDVVDDARPVDAREFARFAPRLSFADGTGLFRLLEGLRFGAARPSS